MSLKMSPLAAVLGMLLSAYLLTSAAHASQLKQKRDAVLASIDAISAASDSLNAVQKEDLAFSKRLAGQDPYAMGTEVRKQAIDIAQRLSAAKSQLDKAVSAYNAAKTAFRTQLQEETGVLLPEYAKLLYQRLPEVADKPNRIRAQRTLARDLKFIDPEQMSKTNSDTTDLIQQALELIEQGINKGSTSEHIKQQIYKLSDDQGLRSALLDDLIDYLNSLTENITPEAFQQFQSALGSLSTALGAIKVVTANDASDPYANADFERLLGVVDLFDTFGADYVPVLKPFLKAQKLVIQQVYNDSLFIGKGKDAEANLEAMYKNLMGTYNGIEITSDKSARWNLPFAEALFGKIAPYPRMHLEKQVFDPGDSITVHFVASDKYDNSAWIGVVPSNIPHGSERTNDKHDLDYKAMNGKYCGTLSFQAPDKPGSYDLRMHDNDPIGFLGSAAEVASITFQVRDKQTDTLTASMSNETIKASIPIIGKIQQQKPDPIAVCN